MVLGLHWSSVSEATVADALSIILSFSLATWATASATEDVGTSAAMSTPLSNHCRAIETATSGLFWWSALMTSTSQSRWDFISSTASCVAATDVGPVLSRYVPERSVSTPIVSLTRPCARGRIIGASDNAAAPPIRVRRVETILLLSLVPTVRPRPCSIRSGPECLLNAQFPGCSQGVTGIFKPVSCGYPA